jgi:ABC-2 type transport system ATP-binding protein
MDDPVIEIVGLHKAYDGTAAVDGLSLSVGHGEIVGLLGPNGAGKTTTIECLLGMREADEGQLKLFGIDRGAESPAIRVRLGIQLQTTGMLQLLTVREQVALFAKLFPRHLPVDEILSYVGLEDMTKTPTRSLSGGQKQRLAVALALVNDPDLLFLDEPTTGLDPQARRALWDVITSLRTRGKTVLLTTHYMEEAAHLCDRVAIVDHGKIIEMGSPEALIRKHFKETAIEFISNGACDQGAFEPLVGVARILVENGSVTLYTTDVPRTMAGLFDLVEISDLAFDDITVRQASLEDVFLKLAGRRIRR